jgi:hypothetical protein
MAFQSDGYDHVEFDLGGSGSNSALRVDMRNKPNERNRNIIADKGERFTVSATLLDAAHGQWATNSAEEATLLIVSFRFIPPKNRRFTYARIDWTFTSDDPAIDISIKKLAPDADWALDPVTLKLERTNVVGANLGASFPPGTAGANASHESKKSKDLDYHTTVSGNSRMGAFKDEGGHNSARWVLIENPEHRQGICTMLQAAVLLIRTIEVGKTPKARADQTFKSTMEIAVEKASLNPKGVLNGIIAAVEDVASAKAKGDEPVIYHPDDLRESGDFVINKGNLRATDLEDIMFMSLSSSWAELKRERQEKQRVEQEAEEKKMKEAEEETRKLETQRTKDAEERSERDIEGSGEDLGQATKNPRISQSAVPGVNTFAPHQPVQGMLPGQTPSWLYILLGVLGMYAFQQFTKSWW